MSKTKFTITGVDGHEPITKCCKMAVYGDDVSDGTHTMNELKRGFVGKLILVQLTANEFVVARHMIDYQDGDGQNVPIYEKVSQGTSIGMAIALLAEKKHGAGSKSS